MNDPYKNVIPRLTSEKLKTLVKSLPKPRTKIKLGKHKEIKFEMYRVKKMHNPDWENPVLFKLLLHARGSFYIYSELPPLDGYDLKSEIYLIRTCYNAGTVDSEYPVEEWVSTRFIPYYGDPRKFRDLEMFEYRRRLIEYWVKKRLLDPVKLDWDSVVGASGLCGIETFPVSENNAFSLRYTSLAFALIVKQFVKNCENNAPPYLMVQVPEEFVQKVLTFRVKNREFRPNFTLASDMLMIKKAAQVKLCRDNRLIYHRPLYFLNRKALFELLGNLIRKKVLTPETFEYYMGDPALVDKILNKKEVAVSEFSKLGRIFSINGRIYGANVTGTKLRDILKKVPDGPQLRIMKTDEFILSLQKMIDVADSL